jgi:hypothetical protein
MTHFCGREKSNKYNELVYLTGKSVNENTNKKDKICCGDRLA